MSFTKKLIASSVATAVVSAAAFAPVANAEVSASLGIASSYLWRGKDLGQGTPAVSGDISASIEGFYGGAWVSSGDSSSGTEYDLYAGYGGESGDFSYDISVWNYLYPQGDLSSDTIADLSELIVTLGYGPVSFSWYENIATEGGDESYRYYTLGGSFGKFGVTIGHHDTETVEMGSGATAVKEIGISQTHIDVSYAYNDNLTFTLSQMVKAQLSHTDASDDDLNMVVSYSVPLD